jgi:hypothetical protein
MLLRLDVCERGARARGGWPDRGGGGDGNGVQLHSVHDVCFYYYLVLRVQAADRNAVVITDNLPAQSAQTVF